MYVAVLIADPKHCPLDPDALTALRTAWAGSEARWLATSAAAEFALEAIPGNRWHMWEVLQREGIDLCIVPAANRQKRLLIADMDSTMIAQECIDELAEVAGIGARVKEITARAMNGELDFEAALRARVALLKGLEVSVIDDVLATRITEAPGGRALLRTMKAGGATTLLVSGGFTAFSSVVAARIGFDRHQANILEAKDGHLTGKVREPILGRAAKVDALMDATRALGIEPSDALAVGDGANDLGMLGRAGMGVALHAKPAVAAECDLRINHGDLTALLYLQGYGAERFA